MQAELGEDLPELALDLIEEFLTGVHRIPEPKRVLATVLFTDIVGSTDSLWGLGCQVAGEACLTRVGRRPRLAGEGEGRLVAP